MSTFLRFWLLLLVFVGAARATVFAAVADGPCLEQSDFRSACVYTFDASDPNSPAGAKYSTAPILGPISSVTFDPNTDLGQWLVPVGKLVRTAPVCFEAGWVADTISVVDSTSMMTVTWDTDQLTWTLSGDALPGTNWCIVEASNRYANSTENVVVSRTVCVVWFGVIDHNDGPVLSWIVEWLNIS